MKKYNGNYLGLVVEDFDPEYRNRVKVFVPAISATLLNKINSKRKNLIISGVGVNLLNHLDDDAYEELIRILPWAECAAPLFGGGTSMHYNRKTKYATNKNNPGANTGAQPGGTVGDSSGRSQLGREKDAFSGQGLNSGDFLKNLTPEKFNKLKFVASIGYRETGFSQQQAYTDANNKLNNNTEVLKEYIRIKKIPGLIEKVDRISTNDYSSIPQPIDPEALALAQKKAGDYGFYQTNGFNGKGRPSMNGVEQATSTALEQTISTIDYIDNVLSKQHVKNTDRDYDRFGVSEVIAAGDFKKAELMLNNFWNSLPLGKSHHSKNKNISNTDPGAQVIQATTLEQFQSGKTALNAAVDTTPFSPANKSSLKNSSTAIIRQLLANRQMIINENSHDINASYTTGIPGGMFSTPKINSHVWVFFNEGDPQYPVYFAQHVVVADWQRIKQVSSPGADQGNVDSDTSRKTTTALAQPGSGVVQFITQHEISPETKEMRDHSGIKFSTAGGGTLALMTHGHMEYAPVNKTTKVAGNYFLTVEGQHQTAISSSQATTVAENSTLVIGDISNESIQAVKAIRELLKKGHDRSVLAHKEPSGKTVKCPICYGAVSSEKGTLVSKLLTRLSTAVLNLFGRDTVASRHVGEVLKVAIAPLKDTTVRKIRKGDCGNPKCVNGQVPEYNSNIPQIEQEMADYLEGVFDKITENEKKLGIGGNQTTIVAKNSLTKVGLLMNHLDPFVEVRDAIPINNGVEFIRKEGPVASGDSVSMFKTIQAPSDPTGVYDLIVGNKYNLSVGSNGIHMHTRGNIELHGGQLEISSNFISLGNNKGITKITGAAVQIEASKSITLGGAPTNVHIKGNAHVTANITAQGSIYADGSIYAKRLVIPSAVQKTDLASAADYTSGCAAYSLAATTAFMKSGASKIPKHYNPTLSGLYPATGAGMSDILVDWLTRAQLSNFYDNWGAPTGVFYGVGSGTVFTWPHIHLHHNSAHSHSFKGPDGMLVNDQEEIPELAAGLGGAVTQGSAPIPDKG